MIPPPQTSTIKIPEAASVYLPSPSTARLKIPPHITEVHNPQRIKKATFNGTLAIPNQISLKNTGIPTVVSAGLKIDSNTNTAAKEAVAPNIALLEILAPNAPPNRRPISIKNQ